MTNVASQLAAKASAPLRSRGVGFAVACACVFSVNTICARIAFQGGADAPTGNAVRFAFTLLVLLLVAAFRRRRRPLTLRQRIGAFGLGIFFSCCSFGYMESIQYIPVSIAVLVLYTYPILVGLLARVVEGERLGSVRLLALVIAFLGLALALNVQSDALPDWRGVMLAFFAACGMALMVTGSSRVLRGADQGALNFHLVLSASVIFVVLLFVGDGPVWPETELGWVGMAGLLVTFAAGQLTLIAAIGRAGSVVTAAVMNLEPLITTALAILLVRETLSATQLAGAALVIFAIFLTSRAGRRMPAPIAEP